MRSQTLPYHRHIDGLRAIAIGLVVLFHLLPTRVTGGFVGVDVFFVISGYLITGLVIRQSELNSFTLGAFYMARVRRLAPALGLVLLASILAGGVWLARENFRMLGRDVLAAIFFVSNLQHWSHAGYFDVDASERPLLHLWSLGVEAQFYLLWPPLLRRALKSGESKARALALALAAASFGICVLITPRAAELAFYSPVTRLWEPMIGAVLALSPRLAVASWARGTIAVAGLALILAAACTYDGASAFPGWRAALPALGAAMMLGGGDEADVNRGLLSSRPFVGLGLISYPLYLWHWPMLAFARIARVETGLTMPLRIALLGASILLAWATWRFVERGMRSAPRRWTVGIGTLAGAAVLVASTGIPGRPIDHDFARQYVARYAAFARGGLQTYYRPKCDFFDARSNGGKDAIDPACLRAGARGTVLLWGDSHAQALSWGLRTLLGPGVGLAQITTSLCRPSLFPAPPDRLSASCDRSNALALATVARLRPRAVVIAQQADHERTDWDAVARTLRARGACRVVLVGPVAQWRPSLPAIIAAHGWHFVPERVAPGLDPQIARTQAALEARYKHSPVLTLASPYRLLCDSHGCQAVTPGTNELTVVDYGHLMPAASAWIVRETILPAIGNIGLTCR